jgi:hypothetical protein
MSGPLSFRNAVSPMFVTLDTVAPWLLGAAAPALNPQMYL